MKARTIRVLVTPDARRERVEREEDGSYNISVREPAAGNMANERVRAIVAAHEGASLTKVRLVRGHRSPRKMIEVLI